mgnify:CR=1 FL=1
MEGDGAGGGASLGPDDALDVLHVTGQSDDGGGYLQLRDNKQLRNEARRLISEGICEGNAFDLLRRADAMGQQEVKNVIMERLLRRGCCPDPGACTEALIAITSGALLWIGWWDVLDEDLVPGLHEKECSGRNDGNPLLLLFDLLWNTDGAGTHAHSFGNGVFIRQGQGSSPSGFQRPAFCWGTVPPSISPLSHP